jgi:Uma2 family endonuclease
METEKHRRQMNVLIESLNLAWAERNDFYVSGNMFVYYSELQTRQNDFKGPDVFVVLDTHKHERLSWVVWEEGGKTPDVVIELLSATTETTDRGEKMDIYAKILNVGEYYLFDPLSGELEGYRLDREKKQYTPIPPLHDGSLPSGLLGLRLTVSDKPIEYLEGPWLRWIDDGDALLPVASELVEHEKERAEQEAQRAEQESRRALELAEKLAAYEAKFGKLE